LGQKLIAQQTVDDAKAAAEAAQARLKAARETLNLVLAGPRKEDIAAARATLKAREAEFAFARQQLADADLYAPANGVIQNRILEPGDMVSPQTPVYTLALTDPVWVRAYIAESDLGKIRLGMLAQVSTDSYPGKHYRAWVGFISPTAEFTPKSVETTDVRTSLVYQVRIFVCNPQNQLRLGMPATVTIPLSQDGESGIGAQEPCKES
jgi:HlyD family secretion protein